MLELLMLGIALFGSAFAGIWDLKTSDIPDWIVFPMAGLGIGLNAMEGYMASDYALLKLSLFWGGSFALFGTIMYFARIWGGGDGALLASIGFLLPRGLYAGAFPFPLEFFLVVIVLGSFYSIAYIFACVLRDRGMRRQLVGAVAKNRALALAFASIGFAVFMLFPNVFTFLLFIMIALMPALYHLSNIAERVFSRRILAKELREGDMIGQDIPRLKIYKRYIRGLSKEEVRRIKRSMKRVTIRDGVRYGPVFFLSLLVTLLIDGILAGMIAF